jgi:hypothetical protein
MQVQSRERSRTDRSSYDKDDGTGNRSQFQDGKQSSPSLPHACSKVRLQKTRRVFLESKNFCQSVRSPAQFRPCYVSFNCDRARSFIGEIDARRIWLRAFIVWDYSACVAPCRGGNHRGPAGVCSLCDSTRPLFTPVPTEQSRVTPKKKKSVPPLMFAL